MSIVWPRLGDLRSVRKTAKSAAVAGIIFSGLTVLGLYLAWYEQVNFHTLEHLSAEEMTITLIAVAIQIVLMLFFSWRVWTGKGYVSACLLFLLMFGEMLVGGFNFVHALILFALFHGVRATFAYKKFRTQGDVEAQFE